MSTAEFVAGLLVGSFAFVGAGLLVIFLLVRGAQARRSAALRQEGLVLDSGRVRVETRFSGFRGAGLVVGVGQRRGAGVMVLTRQRLVITGQRYGDFPREVLGRFEVGLDEAGRVHLHSDQPPNASGTIDFHVAAPGAQAWVAALVEAGARRRGG